MANTSQVFPANPTIAPQDDGMHRRFHSFCRRRRRPYQGQCRQGQQGDDPADNEWRLPVEQGLHDAGDERRARVAQRVARRVDAGAAKLCRPDSPVGQHLEAGHVDAGHRRAAYEAQREREPEAVSPDAERNAGNCPHERRTGKHPPTVEAIRQARQDRRGDRVAREVDAADPAGLPGGQVPPQLQVGQDRGHRHQRNEIGDENESQERRDHACRLSVHGLHAAATPDGRSHRSHRHAR
jgi:hypothetical protein